MVENKEGMIKGTKNIWENSRFFLGGAGGRVEGVA